MGFNLFKSRTKTSVATTVSRVIADDLLPNSVKTGLINGLFSGDQMAERVLEEMTSSIGIRAERMYKYGKEGYVYGLPKSTLLRNTSGEAIAKGTIEALEGRSVTLDYYRYGPLNNLHFGWTTLVNQYGYNQASNEIGTLSAIKGFPVYLQDMQVVVVEATLPELENGSLAHWGVSPRAGYTPRRPVQVQSIFSSVALKTIAHTPFALDATAATDYLRVSYVWKETITEVVNGKSIQRKVIKEDFLTIPVTGLDVNKGYFQIKYSYEIPQPDGSTPTTVIKYWTYQDGLGTYPELDAIYATEYDDLGSFFPFAHFRYSKHPASLDPNSDTYKSSKKLLKYLNIDFKDVVQKIDENPDVDDVEQAMMMLAVPAETSNQLELRYLFDFFKRTYLETGGIGKPLSTVGAGIASVWGQVPQYSVVIEDARFKMALNFTGIYRHKRVGVIAPVGEHTMGTSKTTIPSSSTVYQSSEDTVGTTTDTTTVVPYHWYRRQITSTLYEEIQVYELEMKYFVWGSYTTTSDGLGSTLLIPLDYSITQDYYSMDRETLYARSLHFVFNSRILTKVKWYQSSWFRAVMIIVALAITLFSGGADGGQSLAAALAAGTVNITAYAIMVFVIKVIVVKLVVQLFVKAVGIEAAMVIALLFMAYGGYGQLTGTGGVPGAPWSQELMQLSTSMTKGVEDALGDAMLGIKEEADLFATESKEKLTLLEEQASLLKNDNWMTPLIIWGESPEQYCQRTIHSGNIGTLCFDALHNYVDMSLTLPTIEQTLGMTSQRVV